MKPGTKVSAAKTVTPEVSIIKIYNKEIKYNIIIKIFIQ